MGPARHGRRMTWPGLIRGMAAVAVAASLAMPAAADEAAYVISFKDGSFSPARLEVPAEARVKIVLRNVGTTPVEFESRSLRKEKVLGAGVESFVVLIGPAVGDYDFFDDFHPDAGKGVIAVK